MKTFLAFVNEAKSYLHVSEPFAEIVTTRDEYISGNIFKDGSLVEQISTGKIGTVMRRGTNYLICLTDNGELFKPWINDSKEI